MWLVYIGFPTHLYGLRDNKIKPSFRLPAKKNILSDKVEIQKDNNDDNNNDNSDSNSNSSSDSKDNSSNNNNQGGGDNSEGSRDRDKGDLRCITAAAESLLQGGYKLVAD